MKVLKIIVAIIVIMEMQSCSSIDSELTLGEYRVTYEATVEKGLWYGNYTDGQGNSICVCEEPFQPDGWMHSFATSELPDELTFVVTSQFYADSTIIDKPDVSASIYMNGKLLKSETNAVADGKTKVSVIPSLEGKLELER